MVDLLIKGFKNGADVKEFIDWYLNSGEQDFATSLEYCENPNISECIDCDAKKTFPLKCIDNVYQMYVH